MPHRELSWLHLSDLHVGLEDHGTDWAQRIERFLDDVEEVLSVAGPVDLVLFTGDLTQGGEKEEFQRLDTEVLEPLWQRLSNAPLLLAVPGNHDLQRPSTKRDQAFAQAILRNADDLWSGDAETVEFIRARFANYEEWWQNHPRRPREGYQGGLLPGDFAYVYEKQGSRYGLAGLNTAALHLADVNEGDLWVDKRQLVPKACGSDVSRWLKSCRLGLLLTHHPAHWLAKQNRQESFASGLSAHDFHFHLFGHMHEALAEHTERGGGKLAGTLQASSLFGLETYTVLADGNRPETQTNRVYGYTVGRIEADGASVHLRLWPRRAESGQDSRWHFGSDRSYVLTCDVVAAQLSVPHALRGPAPAAETPAEPTAGSERAVSQQAAAAPAAVQTGSTPHSSWSVHASNHPLWDRAQGSDRDAWRKRARAVVGQCELAANNAAIKRDPWRDQSYPVRVLDRLADVNLADDVLSPAQVMLLVTAPFVHEALWAQGLAWIYKDGNPEDFSVHAGTKEPRLTVERAHRAFPQVIRRAERLTPVVERRALALWLAHRALEHVPQLWEPRASTPLTELHDILAQKADDAYTPLVRLVRCVGGDIPRIDGEQGLLRDPDCLLGGAPIAQARLGTLLMAASAAALDVRAVDEVAVHHVGGPEGFTVSQLIEAVSWGRWERNDDARVFTCQCHDPVQHFCVTDLVVRADKLTKALRALPGGLGRGLPSELSARGVVPETDELGEPRFRPIHVRFRLDHHRIRELLMGQALYGEPTLALRELYQNALDACRYRRARTEYLRSQPDALGIEPDEGKIVFRQGTASDGRMVIECQDNGVGMTERMIEHVFAVAGRRFRDEPAFLEESGRWQRAGIEFYPNSQHGIGVLSYFMLADEIELETRAYGADGRKGVPLRVRISAASGLFHVTDADDSLGCGTRVRLYLNKGASEDQQAVSAISAAKILRELLVIAEFSTEVYDGAEERNGVLSAGVLAHRWEPGVPSPLKGVLENSSIPICPTDVPDLWWSATDEGPVLADGIRTDETIPFALVNLRGSRYPSLSANRKQITAKRDYTWVVQGLERSTARLSELEPLSLVLLFQLFTQYPGALVRWDDLVRRRGSVPFATGAEPLSIMADIRAFEHRETWPPQASLQKVGWMPSDMSLLYAPHPPIVHAFAAWRLNVWEGTLGDGWPRLHAHNPRLDPGEPPPVLQLGILLNETRAGGLFSRVPSSLPAEIAELIADSASSSYLGSHRSRVMRWAEERLGLPIADPTDELHPASGNPVRQPFPAPVLDEIDQQLVSLIQKGPRTLLDFQKAASPVFETMRNVSPAEMLARLRKLALLSGIELPLDIETLAGMSVDEGDFHLIKRYCDEAWPCKEVPATHVLYAARDLAMGVDDVAARWTKLAPLFGLKLDFALEALAGVNLEGRDWQLLSQDLDGTLADDDWSVRVAFGRELPAPWLHGAVPGAHVLFAARELRIVVPEVIARLQELADPLRLRLSFDADALTAVLLSKQDWRLLSRGLSGNWPWLSEVPAAHVLDAARDDETPVYVAVARLAELAAPMGLTLRPCVMFLCEPVFDALIEAVAQHSAPPPYDGFDARRCTELWVLHAGINVNQGVQDPERALLCAGRWWLWWLTDETLRALGESLLQAVIAEKERGPVR